MPRRRAFPPPAPIHRAVELQGSRNAIDTPSFKGPPYLGPLEGVVEVPVGDRLAKVEIDPDNGPRAKYPDGSMRFYSLHCMPDKSTYSLPDKKWLDMTSTEQEVMVYFVARRNVVMDELLGVSCEQSAEAVEVDQEAERAKQEALVKEEWDRREARCTREMTRGPVFWTPVGLEVVTTNHAKHAKGMIYGLDFPWNEETLAAMGPEWMTTAFHIAGTLDPDNAVTAVILEKKIKVTGGNNGGKFLFEVRYKRAQPGLHTKLFAKVPFPCSGPTKTDRLSSSVYKQPMDLTEINAYRLLETRFPMQTPKFYFGDISNETTNFIIITERVPFAEVGGKWLRRPLRPFEIEGPYDKCKDFQFRSPASEYYTLLFQMSGKLAGLCKAGKVAHPSLIEASFMNIRASPSSPEAWGMNPGAPTGEDPKNLMRKLETALDYLKTANVVFPEYVTSAEFREKFKVTLMTASAHKNEIDYWKHSDPDYIALAHTNLNSDNAYFWRDEDGNLDCGVFDWGGLGNSCLGHKLWWCINCADYENTSVNMDSFIDAFITTYREYGGPEVDPNIIKLQMFLTSLDNTLFMVAAVPNCHTMCPLKEWATIKDRHDPRIAGNIDGKSTLRTTLHVLNHGVRIIHELDGDKMLEKWINEVWTGAWMMPQKSEATIGLV